MANIDNRPKCPKCGAPARCVTGPAIVRFELDDDGLPGKVVRIRAAVRPTTGALSEYVCGGGHTWYAVMPADPV